MSDVIRNTGADFGLCSAWCSKGGAVFGLWQDKGGPWTVSSLSFGDSAPWLLAERWSGVEDCKCWVWTARSQIESSRKIEFPSQILQKIWRFSLKSNEISRPVTKPCLLNVPEPGTVPNTKTPLFSAFDIYHRYCAQMFSALLLCVSSNFYNFRRQEIGIKFCLLSIPYPYLSCERKKKILYSIAKFESNEHL